MLEIGSVPTLLALERITVGSVPVVVAHIPGWPFLHDRRFDDVVSAPGDVPFALPAHTVGESPIQRDRDKIPSDQDGKYQRPFEPVDGIVCKHMDQCLSDAHIGHSLTCFPLDGIVFRGLRRTDACFRYLQPNPHVAAGCGHQSRRSAFQSKIRPVCGSISNSYFMPSRNSSPS